VATISPALYTVEHLQFYLQTSHTPPGPMDATVRAWLRRVGQRCRYRRRHRDAGAPDSPTLGEALHQQTEVPAPLADSAAYVAAHPDDLNGVIASCVGI
jgi:hypothetical protein